MICSCLFTVRRVRSGVLVDVTLQAIADWTGEAFVNLDLKNSADALPWRADDVTAGERDRLRATLERDRDERQRAQSIELAAKARAS